MERGRTSADPDDEAEDRPVGTLIADKFRVVRPIGSGSMGSVYLCQHEGLDRLVALKVLHREIEQNAGFVERFKREAKAASRLEHANSVRVLDFGQDQAGALYIVMEYIEGRDLLRVLDEDGPFSAERAIDVMSQILDALSVAHSLGIVHRDLKPENVVTRIVQVDGVDKELVTVCDFGIAQLAPIRLSGTSSSDVVSISDIGLVVGTPAYMSPEQARAEAQDARSDIYSAGILLFQLLTLHLPFSAETPLAVAVLHCTEPPPRPSQFGAVSPALEAICLKALSKTPAARYQSAREMRAALQQVLQAAARPVPRQHTPISWLPVRSLPAAAAALVGKHSLFPVERFSQPDSVPPGQRLHIPRRVWGIGLVLAGIASLAFLVRSGDTNMDRGEARRAKVSVPPPTAASERVASALPAALDPPRIPTALPTPAPAAHVTQTAGAPAVAPAPTPKRSADRSSAVHGSAKTPGAVEAAKDTATSGLAAQPSAAGKSQAEPPVVTPSAAGPAVAAASTGKTAAVPPNLAAAAPRPAAPSSVVRAPDPTPSTATVSIGSIVSRAAVSKASVRGALNLEALTVCYRDALKARAAPPTAVNAQLELATNMVGGVSSATFRAPGFAESARQCIEQVARRGRVREVDTGQAQASITLFFQPR